MIEEKVHRARNVGVPIIGIECYDPTQTIKNIIRKFQEEKEGKLILKEDTTLICKWDIINGVKALNPKMDKILKDTFLGSTDTSFNPEKFLTGIKNLPKGSMVFMLNAQRIIIQADDKRKWEVNQAIWNLRDKFKNNGSTLILLGPSLKLPEELVSDVLMLSEALPTKEELEIIVNKTIYAAIKNGVDSSKFDNIIPKTVNSLVGLSAYAAEQTLALATYKNGIRVEEILERKIRMINHTDGLQVYQGKETFKDIGGCDVIKERLLRIGNGKDAPKVIVFIDEGEKMFAGATSGHTGDGGVAKDSLGVTLQFMENTESEGAIFVGPPGTAKSAVAKAFGNEIGVPTIMMDFGGLRGGVVGESERKIREAYKIIDAIGGGNIYFIMTCNKEVSLPPELKRRFTTGTFFFDLPNIDEQKFIWELYLKKYGQPYREENFSYKDWTGAEIRNVCRTAFRENISLTEASEYIIPVAVSAKETIQALREAANGRWLSANYKGAYKLEEKENDGREFDLI